ncbi:MAG: signal peptidase II [Eubacterium sp.]|nr:signal peptidase II [Eubacterium sp.]
MLYFFLCTILFVCIDQASKQAAQQMLRGKAAVSLIPGVFELLYLENRGSAFGLMQGQKFLFLSMAGLMLFLIPYLYARIPLTRRFWYLRMIAVLFLSGAVGNAIDRMVNGYVIDFFYVSLIDFPIFNVADIYVTVSTFLLIVLMLFYYKDEDFEQIHIFSK